MFNDMIDSENLRTSAMVEYSEKDRVLRIEFVKPLNWKVFDKIIESSKTQEGSTDFIIDEEHEVLGIEIPFQEEEEDDDDDDDDTEKTV